MPSEDITRRRTDRVKPGPLPIITEDGERGTVVDLSELGALIELRAPRKVGGILFFYLTWNGTAVSVHGRVVRSSAIYDSDRVVWADPDSYHVGVEFFDLAATAAETLQQVKKVAKDGATPSHG